MSRAGQGVGHKGMRRLCAAVCLLAAALPAVAQVEEAPVDPLYQRMADNFVRLIAGGWEALRTPASAKHDTVASPPPALEVPQRADTAANTVTPPPANPAPSDKVAKAAATSKPLPALANTLIPPSPPPTLPAPTVAAAPKAASKVPATAAPAADGATTTAKAASKAKKQPIDREAVLAEHGDDVTAEAANPSGKPASEIGRGLVSWYGPGLHGRKTASGEPFDMNGLTAAHRTLPFGTKVRVRNMATGREVVVRINDRGPHTKGRIIDLSRKAAEALGVTNGDHMVMLLSS